MSGKNKINWWEKSEALEISVLRDTPKEIETEYKRLGSVEFSARALGLACRFRGLETVKVLVENGAEFRFDAAKLEKLAGRSRKSFNFAKEHEKYFLALLTGEAYIYLTGRYAKENGLCPLPIKERLLILDFLCDNAEKTGLDMEELLFKAYISDEKEIIALLKKRGAELSAERKRMLTEGGNNDMWLQYSYLMGKVEEDKFVSVVTNLLSETGEDKKLHFTETFYYWSRKKINDPELLSFILEHFNQSKMNKTKFMKDMIDSDRPACLAAAAEHGWLKLPRKRDEMIRYASDNEKTECMAWLLDFKNRTADFKAEREKAEKKLMRELNVDPNSPSELKKNWKCEKKKDGTLKISRYTGHSKVITVPGKIGDDKVTEIGDWAFSPHQNRTREQTSEFRKTITKIILPDGLKKIGENAFCDLISLESVNIPKSVRSIGECAFCDCRSLKTVIVPEGVTNIGANAFSVQNGVGALEYVELPSTLKYFSGKCKWRRVYLFNSASCPKLTVGVPNTPYTEEFCGHNEIKFKYTEDK